MELSAKTFVEIYFPQFNLEEIRERQIGEEDIDVGVNLSVEINDGVCADMQLLTDQVSLTIIESGSNDSNILFHGVISFAEQFITINGEPVRLFDESVADLIHQFNELTN